MTDPTPTPDPAATEGATPPNPAPTPPSAPDTDPPLGPNGEKALAAERARADAEAKARKDLEERLAKLDPLLAALGGQPAGDTKSDLDRLTERLAAHETELASERQARWRAEVAAEKGLTVAQAARLVGDSREALAADADALVALFPAAPPPLNGAPRPDPSQGGRGGAPASDLESRIAEAERSGNHTLAISLKAQKLDQL